MRNLHQMFPIALTHQLELVHMDFLMIESRRTRKDINVLVVTDHFMHFSQAYMTRSQTASVIAKTVWDNFFHALWPS